MGCALAAHVASHPRRRRRVGHRSFREGAPRGGLSTWGSAGVRGGSTSHAEVKMAAAMGPLASHTRVRRRIRGRVRVNSKVRIRVTVTVMARVRVTGWLGSGLRVREGEG